MQIIFNVTTQNVLIYIVITQNYNNNENLIQKLQHRMLLFSVVVITPDET